MISALRQFIAPRFPALLVTLVHANGEAEDHTEEEVDTILEREKFSYYSIGGRDVIVYGGTIGNKALQTSPSRLYTGSVFSYIAFWYSILYSLVVLSTLDEFSFLWGRPWFIAIITALAVHILYNIRLMMMPTISRVTLLEFGETSEGVRVYVPGPYPLSNTSLKEFYSLTARSTLSVELLGKEGKEIVATLAVLRRENEVLKIRNAKLLESYDEMEDRVMAEALSRVPREILEREREAYRRQVLMLSGALVVAAFLAFILGFVMAGGVIGVTP